VSSATPFLVAEGPGLGVLEEAGGAEGAEVAALPAAAAEVVAVALQPVAAVGATDLGAGVAVAEDEDQPGLVAGLAGDLVDAVEGGPDLEEEG
jgi:hypothetical protein